ncbi:MAG: glycosyltransferase [Bacteroidetes bacterium]|nr:glycosyltransferase [Bacteroidota bacterium]
MKPKRILIAPMDWGLGHATRCIPVINELLHQGAEVVIAADHRPAALLRREFPQLEHVRYPGAVIDYPANANMAWTMFRQLPVFFKGIADEHALLDTLITDHRIDGVISDNRWGAYSSRVPSVLIIHQIRILLSRYIRWAQGIVDAANRKLIRPFPEVWIPDLPGADNLSGELSHGPRLPKNAHFIGPLSRLVRRDGMPKSLDILAIISGPEPQRTLFETMLVEQLKPTTHKALIVRGTPERNVKMTLTDTLTLVGALTADELSEAIASTALIITRPGYSTVMDLCALGARAVVVPTPQQTEQEYLASRLMASGICYAEPQSGFRLERALERSAQYTGFRSTTFDAAVLRQRISHLLTAAA